ncbi:MAG TPA: hypothetical protein VMO26_20695 [Vicinamibacterales bacterium]|nr:hypothetical protein [Vicinamibacterales bacterium]
MMGYISRTDGSILVALPGLHPMGHYAHVPFLMARSGSAIASALQMTPMPGVVAGAFDDRLVNAPDSGFVFRCLEGCDVDIDARSGISAVANRASHLAQMYTIAKGRRLRNDVRRWSQATVTLRGGRLDNSAAHPDAGKIWSFGSHQQPLTDATLYTADDATLQLSAGSSIVSYSADNETPGELWVISSAGPRTDAPNPKRLEHGAILFQYFAEAEPVIATCEEAEGRLTLATELPCSGNGLASRVGRITATAPPHVDLCYGGGWCDDPDGCV